MSLTKYIDLLHRKKLFLSRIDRFDDPYEGQWTNARKEYSPFRLDLDGENGLINTVFNKQYFISCWHLSEHELRRLGCMLFATQHSTNKIAKMLGWLSPSQPTRQPQLFIPDLYCRQ
jgi:hypothetical protein